MKYSRLLAYLLLAFALAAGVTTAAQAATRIAVVNPQRLIKEAPQAEAARARLKHEFATRRNKLQSMQQEIVNQAKKLRRDKSVMSKSELQRKEDDLNNQQENFKQQQDEYNKDVSQREKAEFGTLRKKIYDVIVSIAKRKGYDIVLSDGVVYATDPVNITDDVLDQLKKENR